MRLVSFVAAVTVSSLVLGCGYFNKKKKSNDDSSADAIADDSAIHWDTDYSLTGKLTEDSSRSSTYKYTLSTSLDLVLSSEANMRLVPGVTTSKCPTGARLSGVYYTLTSSDGLYVRSTDAVDQAVPPAAIDAFPGRVPSGHYVLEVRAYGTGPCTVDSSYRFPNPNPVDDFPDDEDGSLDQDLLGVWQSSDNYVERIATSTMLTFGSDQTAAITMKRGDLVVLDYRAKYRLDMQSKPRRAIVTVTSVNNSQANPNISVDAELRCIYYGNPVGAALSLSWECNDSTVPGFPVDFGGDKALEFARVGSGPTGVYDFELTKGGAVSLPVPDNDDLGTAYTFEFSTESSRLVDVGISFAVNHTNVGDLSIKLVHPDGTEALLYDRVASTSHTLSKSFGLGGSRLDAFDAFKGKTINGKWKLKVADESPGDTGTLTNATLTVRGHY